MTTQRPTVTTSGIKPDPNPAIVDEKLKEIEEVKRLVSVLERGVHLDRLSVPSTLDDEYHYEWERDNPEDINSKKLLGFELDTSKKVQSTHNQGDEYTRVQDVILMKIPKERMALIEKAKRIVNIKKHGDPRIKEQLIQNEYNSNFGDGNKFEGSSVVRTLDYSELDSVLKSAAKDSSYEPSREDATLTPLLDHDAQLVYDKNEKKS